MQVKFSSLPLRSLDNDGNVPAVRRFAARQRRAFEYHARRGGRIVARFSSMIHINGTCLDDLLIKSLTLSPCRAATREKKREGTNFPTLRIFFVLETAHIRDCEELWLGHLEKRFRWSKCKNEHWSSYLRLHLRRQLALNKIRTACPLILKFFIHNVFYS